jgi:hypothetical protein
LIWGEEKKLLMNIDGDKKKFNVDLGEDKQLIPPINHCENLEQI